ncbi:MAG: DUF4390 domain-containing protein [Nitrospiraceae bacterium]|nr:MAG: DUF4390 domain-containing protein [Nitrospiraceae bacterium]
MKKLLLIFFIILYIPLLPYCASAATPYVIGPDIEIKENNIIVNASIAETSDLEQTIRSGVGKEIVFTIELIRVWDFWPDEFVVSKRLRKIIRYDNLRDHYRVSLRDGTTRTDIKFNDFTALKDLIFTANAVSLANIRELEPSNYYIRVIVESKSLEQLPLIGFLMHLVPEVEMSFAKESQTFAAGITNK